MLDERPYSIAHFDPHPSPALSPSEVVSLQLDALQNSDLIGHDTALKIAYRFASPCNRDAVGSDNDFVQLVRSHPLYRDMVGFERAELGTLAYNLLGDQVRLRVWLRRRGRQSAIYYYILTRQTEAPYQGCWMVDAVIREV